MADRSTKQLLAILDQAYDRRSWHGTNLRGSIRNVSAKQARWRPSPKRHNIHELVLHCAYWKYAVGRRLTGAARGSFPVKGSNWFEPADTASESAWRNDVRLLDRMHRTLRGAVQTAPPRMIAREFFRLSGIAAHDLYHAGQIQLLKRLARSR